MSRLKNLTPAERKLLSAYTDPKYGIGRATRLTLQYLIGAGVFLVLAVLYGNPWYALGTYAAFIVFAVVRLLGAKRVADLMPGILAKYENRIAELEAAVPQPPPEPKGDILPAQGT